MGFLFPSPSAFAAAAAAGGAVAAELNWKHPRKIKGACPTTVVPWIAAANHLDVFPMQWKTAFVMASLAGPSKSCVDVDHLVRRK